MAHALLDQAINVDMSQRAVMNTRTMEWQASPSGTVWRKRVHLVGAVESGQVTSVVRYQPNATFPAHDHPEGEEIFVLQGTFSDEHDDWPAGTYLLNPEGFRHAPFSKDGCMLFVKLRQYAGVGRHHVALCTADMEWQATSHTGIAMKPLYAADGFPDRTQLERWEAEVSPGIRIYPGGAEIFVLTGILEDEQGIYGEGTWLRIPPEGEHTPSSPQGCEFYIKTGALPGLRSA